MKQRKELKQLRLQNENLRERVKELHGVDDRRKIEINKLWQSMHSKPKQLHWLVLFLIGFIIGGLLTMGLKRALAEIPPSGEMKAACVAMERVAPFRNHATVYLCETQTISGRKCVIARTITARGLGISCAFYELEHDR